MSEGNMNVDQVAEVLGQASFVLTHEGDTIDSKDIFKIMVDLEKVQSALFVLGLKKEKQHEEG